MGEDDKDITDAINGVDKDNDSDRGGNIDSMNASHADNDISGNDICTMSKMMKSRTVRP